MRWPLSKNFLTYQEQLDYLKNIKGINCSTKNDLSILCRIGYFNLINGYKKPFTIGKKENNHQYAPNTCLNELYQLKNFDDNLRIHLLKYITKIEEEIRTITGYRFDEINNHGQINWYEISAFSPNHDTQNVMKFISNAFQQIEKSRQLYIKHYFDTHKQIPTWILVKTINFSTFINLLQLSKIEVKDTICKLYGLVHENNLSNYKLLISSLHWLRKVRNACAHNERIFDIHRNNGRILTPYFSDFPKGYTRERRQLLIDLFIYMKYYLPADEYKSFINETNNLLLQLKKAVNPNIFDKVRAHMGIKDLCHLELLLKQEKRIDYHS